MICLIKKTIKILLIVFLIQIVFISLYGVFTSCKKGQSDLIVVFGNKVYPDGTLSPALKARMDRAFKAWVNSCAPHILVSGGTGKEGFPEGTAMANYLKQKGVPETSITIDNEGINSYATALNTKTLLTQNNWQSVTVVTSYYHVLRSELAMRLVGIEKVEGTGSRYVTYKDLWKIPRDLAGIYVYAIKYRLQIDENYRTLYFRKSGAYISSLNGICVSL